MKDSYLLNQAQLPHYLRNQSRNLQEILGQMDVGDLIELSAIFQSKVRIVHEELEKRAKAEYGEADNA